jgi:hypothetical protein
MLIYDSLSLAFIRKAEVMLKEILGHIGLSCGRSRFSWNRFTYPINIVVFEGSELGHFNAPYLQIGLNRKLIYSAKDAVVRDILKHELAHYLTYIRYGEVPSHGAEFHSICTEYGFPAQIARATMDLEASNSSKEGDLAAERVLEKVKKLLLLAQSSNVHEAELATLKANEILLRHNLEHLQGQQQEAVYLDRVLQQKRKDAKLSAIYDILKHFIVKTVISLGKNTCCLEVSGSLTNVKLARYVAEFLERELDHLWELTKKEYALQGLRAKNSFFLGVARGFDEKMKLAKMGMSGTDQRALVLVERQLQHDTSLIYRRLSHTATGNSIDENARNLGIQKGKSLTIRQGVEGQAKNLYLPWG